ncbi:MAG: TRAP transporter large permease subunit [Xanthobacteraceae bacterium]|nr:TRAP transporter large permease subunit [Xanthobacteraceae bacterium]
MIEGAALLLGVFFALLFLGVPLGVSLGVSGTLVIALNGLGVMAVPANVWTGIAKYPLLALPVFVLAGMVFERSGVAERLVRFASAVVGNRTGGLALVAILVCIVLGGISGSGPADAAAVATVLAPGMLKQGYPRPFTASLVAAAGSTAILIPPSIAFIVYAVLVPGVSVPALFIGGIVPGLLAGLALMIPALWFAHRHGFGRPDPDAVTPSLWASFKEAIWGLIAPIIILGGLRSGAFTPTHDDTTGVTSPFIVNVRGNGVTTAPDMDVRETDATGTLLANPAPATGILNFGTQDVNAGPTAAAVISVENTGTANLTLGDAFLPDHDHRVPARWDLVGFSGTIAPVVATQPSPSPSASRPPALAQRSGSSRRRWRST